MTHATRIGRPSGLGAGCIRTLIGVLVAAAASPAARGEDFTVTLTPGIGHDRFTETFYLDDSTSVSADSLKRIKTTEDGLRESYGSLGAGLTYGSWRLQTTHYATDAASRNISFGHGRWTAGRLRTDITGRFEWKGTDDEDSLASAYTFYRVDVKPRYNLSDRWWLVLRGDWQRADYQANNPYTVDYHRLRGRAGVEFFGERLETVGASIGLARRTVPDSSRLNYDEVFVNLDAYGWYLGRWRLGGAFAFADRGFDTPDAGNDHRRWSASVRGDLDRSRNWRFSWFSEWQYWDYASDDAAIYDVHSWRLEGSARARFIRQWEIGGLLEWRLEKPSGTVASENEYNQWAAGPIVTWNPNPYVFGELTQRIGYRDYAAASLIYDNYTFWELTAQLDLSLSTGPEVNVTVSYLSETHDDPLRDIDQLYLSLALRVALTP